MAQTKRKRRRKHSGTQAGTVARQRSSTARPQTKAEQREASSRRRAERLDQPPTWRGAATRAGIAAAIFAVVVVLLFGQPPLNGLALAGVMFAIYIPMSYFTDRFIYNRRQRRKETGGEARSPRSER